MADAIALLVEEDNANEAPSRPPGGPVEHAPVVYRVTERQARSASTNRLREQERELRGHINDYRRIGKYDQLDPLDWVRIYALRHELQRRGVALVEI